MLIYRDVKFEGKRKNRLELRLLRLSNVGLGRLIRFV